MAEKIFADFSGGMNQSISVDKMDPRECLLAENVRLDEMGNVQSAGALTRQNTSTYTASAGSHTGYVHSLYWNPSFGAVAGVGQDIFTGPTLGGMTDKSTAKNPQLFKIAFADAPSRVYFDPGMVGYWSDITNVVAVDWEPPNSGESIVGPTFLGTATQTSDTGHDSPWTNPNGIVSSTSGGAGTYPLAANVLTVDDSEYLVAVMSTNSFSVSDPPGGISVSFNAFGYAASPAFNTVHVSLLRNGVPVGDDKTVSVPIDIGSTPDTQSFIVGGSNDLWGVDDWTVADINSGTFGVQVWVEAFDNNFYIYNGKVSVYPLAGSGFVVGTGTTGTLTGTYTYKITFGAASGEESQASAESAPVILSANMGTITAIPTGDIRTSARNIYRKGGTLTSYYFVGSINNNVGTTYADNQTDLNALTDGIILAGDVPGDYPDTRLGSTQVIHPCLHYDRVFWIDFSSENKILWSKPLNGFAYPSVNTLDVGDNKPITKLVSIFGELIIIKTDSIWRLTGTDESSFDLSETPSIVGTDMPFTCVSLPDGIKFANRWGMWLFNGYSSAPLTNKLDTWFKQEDRTSTSLFGVNGFHPPEVSSASVPTLFESVGNSDKMYMAYAESGQTQNNSILVFDLKRNNITKRDIGDSLPLSMAIDPVTGYVYVGDNLGFVSLIDDWNGTLQAGASSNLDFQTCYVDLERGSNKVLWALEFYINTAGQTLTPYVYYDGGVSSETLTSFSTTTLQRVVRKIETSGSRKMQNFSVRLNGTLTAINATGTPKIQLVHIKALYDIRVDRARTGQ